ncbi:hypothetical protein MAIT1_01699 [Magnetofaba australis IT-1]|uniref:Secreted protein n=2 Tax=Magnetofaba TaxID=1472292 RepID=A0A1Y2K0X5_9PROT|nr:hypothetical protein MAIT1_01699 [Magnetofaba australis IT-1]
MLGAALLTLTAAPLPAQTAPSPAETTLTRFIEAFLMNRLDQAARLCAGPACETVARKRALAETAPTPLALDVMVFAQATIEADRRMTLLASTAVTRPNPPNAEPRHEFRRQEAEMRRLPGKGWRVWRYFDAQEACCQP